MSANRMQVKSEAFEAMVKAFRLLLDAGFTVAQCSAVTFNAMSRAMVDEERCGHVVWDGSFGVDAQVYRCGRNAGHEGEHGRRK